MTDQPQQPQEPQYPSFKHFMKDQEMRVRGLYLMVAVDTDWMLGGIMITLLTGKTESDLKMLLKRAYIKTKFNKLHKFTLDDKIKLVKELMKEYAPDLWVKHEKDLEEVDKLRNYRNDLAHGKINWDEENEDGSQLMILTMEADGIHTTTYNRKGLFRT
jgi:hypothetical protein